MSLSERIRNLFGGGSKTDLHKRSYWVRARCRQCGDILSTRIDLINELSLDYDSNGYVARKVLVGSGENRCFNRIEVKITFDQNKRVIDRQITGGDFLNAPENMPEES